MAIAFTQAQPRSETHLVFFSDPADPAGPWINQTRLGATMDDACAEIAEHIGPTWSVNRVLRIDPATGSCDDATKSVARALWLAADWVEQDNAAEIDAFVTDFGFPSALTEHERACDAPYHPAGSLNGRSHDGARL